MTDDIIAKANEIVAAADPAETVEISIALTVRNERLFWAFYRGFTRLYNLEPEHATVDAMFDLFLWWLAAVPGVEVRGTQGGRVAVDEPGNVRVREGRQRFVWHNRRLWWRIYTPGGYDGYRTIGERVPCGELARRIEARGTQGGVA